MTNRAFDELCNTAGYPRVEAAALRNGAVKYWREHKETLVSLRTTLSNERARQPRDPATYTAIALNPDFQAKMKKLLRTVAPDGKYSAAKAGVYLERFRSAVVTEPNAVFAVRAEREGRTIRLIGETSDPAYHNQLIDLFVAMKLYDLVNEIEFPGRSR
jgi:hypothetical protein